MTRTGYLAIKKAAKIISMKNIAKIMAAITALDGVRVGDILKTFLIKRGGQLASAQSVAVDKVTSLHN